MLTEILFFIILTLLGFHCYVRHGRIGKYINKIPGPTAWPIIGNLRSFIVPTEKLWSVVRNMNAEYYPFYKIWSTHLAVINVQHPDDIEVLLTSTQQIEKSLIYELLHPWFGTGLLTSTGSKWQQRRKILTPAFHFNVLQKYMEIILENDKKVINYLKAKGDSTENLVEFTTNYTLNIICESAMGTSLQGKEGLQKKYRNAIHQMGDILVYRLIRPWFKSDTIFKWSPMGRKQTEALKILHGFSTQIISERKDYHMKANNKFLKNIVVNDDSKDGDDEMDQNVFGIRRRRLAMLDLLIAAQNDGNQIDDAGIREEVDTFMFEGHDTSAMGICFVLLLLAEHKDIQARARAEVNEIFNKSNNKIGMAEIQRLNYLERCIKESLRLYPSVPFISRNISQDIKIRNYLIPKGVIAHIHVFDVHRNPNFWINPNVFDPDRFLPERRENKHPFSYIPFSAGPRNCIGQRFAMMEIKALVAHLLYNFYLEPIDLADKVPFICDLVLRPARPIYIKFVSIHK